MDEDFLDVTSGNKHIGIIFLLIIVVFAAFGYFFVFKKIYFSARTVEVELGEVLSEDVKDYLSKKVVNDYEYKLDLSKVNKDEVGEYTYTITHNKTRKKGKIKVIDSKAPTFTLQELVCEEGSLDVFLGDFLETCEDASKPCLVTLKNKKDDAKFNEVGTHSIEIEVADLYGNKKGATATLKVVKKGEYVDSKSLDLEYHSNSKEQEPFKGLIYEKLDKALNKESEAARDAMSIVSTVDLESYVKENYPGYRLVDSEIIVLYNKYDYVIGYSIMLTINNGNDSTIYVDKNKVPKTESEDKASTE